MDKRPSGTVTFLFSDIEGSTRRWEKNAGLMQSAFSRQESIMRNVMHDYGGYVYKMIGDAFQVAFETARVALDAALMAQHSLQDEAWGDIGSVKVRMALHTGVVEERGDDYVGPLLNRVARLMSAGHGGQVLISQAAYELLRDDLPEDVTVLDMGEHRLKDLARPERIYQVISPGLDTDFPPLNTLDAYPNNLPLQLTSFIGREREIEEIVKFLEKDRLITLCGPGGAGKTRLVLQVAANVLHHFEHGVFFVDLAPISDPLFVSRTIAKTLSIRETAGQPLVQSITNFLREKNLLLILDNYEQIIETSPLVGDLLSSAPALKVIVTSRQPLLISGEQEYAVPSMEVPVLEHIESIKGISQYESVELFIKRAQSVRPDFEITDGNTSSIAEICTRLDGLPLAIELAAARIRIMSPEQLLMRLQHRFVELKSGKRDLPPRQQTLLAAIDWSHELLEEPEKELLARLSVFQGGRTIESADAICGPGLSTDILDGMESLTRQSLLFVDQGLEGEIRFKMLETIHEYARQKLTESGQVEEFRERHAEYYLALVEQAESEIRGAQQSYWSTKLRSEHDNVRAALSWSFSDGDPEIGIRMAGALRDYWYYQGLYGEGWNWTETALENIDHASASDQAKLYNTASHLAYFFLGDHQRGIDWATTAQELYQNLGDEGGIAWSHIFLASNFMGYPDQIKTGIMHSEKALTLFQQHDDLPGIEYAFNMIGESSRMDKDYERACPAYEEALHISRIIGDEYREAISLLNMGYVYHHKEDYQREEEVVQEAIKLRRKYRSQYFTAMSLDALASPLVELGELERAAKLAGASQALLDEIGVSRQITEQVERDRYLTYLQHQMDKSTFEKALNEGKAMSLEEATAFALREGE